MSAHAPPVFSHKLTLEQAEELRARHATGETARSLATDYGISVSSVHEILRGRAHVPRILVPLTSVALRRLRAAASGIGAPPEVVAAALIEGALASSASR